MAKKRSSAKKRLRVVFEFVGIIMLWRGIWGLVDLYLFPDSQLVSHIISILLGATLIYVDGDGIRDMTR